jgi:hypothetical protein
VEKPEAAPPKEENAGSGKPNAAEKN